MKHLFNTSGFETEVKCEGRGYTLAPFSEIPMYNDAHYDHIAGKYGYLGIVGLDDEKAGKDYQEYKSAKEIEGLKGLLAYKEQVLSDELTAIKEMKAKGAPDTDKKHTSDEIFREEIKLIKKWLKEAGDTTKPFSVSADVVKERPDWRDKNESSEIEDKNEGLS